MARAEENLRRFSLPNPGPLHQTFTDQLLDVSELSYEFLAPSTCHEDITSSVALPMIRSPKKHKTDKSSNGERSFHCEQCTSTFTNASNLKSHIRTHTGEKPFSCDICNMSFVQSSNLKAHKRIHTGEKPFQCTFCPKSFSRSSHLNGHRRTHTGELPFNCIICKKSFSSSTQLRKHAENKHKENDTYSCYVCDKTFMKEAALNLHLSMHSRERPFMCVLCTAGFRSREDLQVHKKLHPGDQYPFSCKVCGKGFKIKLCCEKHAEKCRLQLSLTSSFPKKNGITYKSDLDFLLENIETADFDLNSFDTPFSNGQSQVFQFEDSQEGNGEPCKVEVFDANIDEDGLEFVVNEQLLVLSNDGENSVAQIIPVNGESISLS